MRRPIGHLVVGTILAVGCAPHEVSTPATEDSGCANLFDASPRDARPSDVSFDAKPPACVHPLEDAGSPAGPCDPTSPLPCGSKTLVCIDGYCAAPGDEGAPCARCESDVPTWCRPGLACIEGLCLRTLPSGSDCVPGEICAIGEQCVPALGRCARYGSAPGLPCRAGACDGDLVCVASTCVHLVASGKACGIADLGSRCTAGATCVADSADDPLTGHCLIPGTLGGECAPSGAPCAEGECFRGWTIGSTCAFQVVDGAACDPMRRTSVCRGGSGCVPSASGFACRPFGTAAGTTCLAAPASCVAPLACVDQRCVREVTGDCDPGAGTDRCAPPAVCGATGYTKGRCTVPTKEGTDAPSTSVGAPLLALPAVFAAGASDVSDDTDCFAVDIPCGGGALYAETNDGMGRRSTDIVLMLFDPLGRPIASADPFNGPTGVLNGASAWSAAHALLAGRYTLCARFGLRGTFAYYLNVSVR